MPRILGESPRIHMGCCGGDVSPQLLGARGGGGGGGAGRGPGGAAAASYIRHRSRTSGTRQASKRLKGASGAPLGQ